MLIDSHCHIHDPQYNFDAKKTLARAHANGVEKIIVIGTYPADNLVAHTFAEAHDGVYWSYGCHPHEGAEANLPSDIFSERRVSRKGVEANLPNAFLDRLSPARTATSIPDGTDKVAVGEARLQSLTDAQRMIIQGDERKESSSFFSEAPPDYLPKGRYSPAESGSGEKGIGRFAAGVHKKTHGLKNSPDGEFATNKLVAIGEIGLDYHYKPYNRQQQIKLFEQMLDLAQKQNLPIIFHVREAYDDFWPIVDNAGVKNAVLHSFSDSEANLNQAIKRNFYIGINGIVTFAPIPLPPLERILLETDAPYLTPKPFRGKINEPSYIKNIAEWVADKLQVSPHTVATQTTESATKLFNL